MCGCVVVRVRGCAGARKSGPSERVAVGVSAKSVKTPSQAVRQPIWGSQRYLTMLRPLSLDVRSRNRSVWHNLAITAPDSVPTLKAGSLSSQGLRPPHGCLIMLSGGSNSRLNNPKLFDMLCGEMVGMVGDGGDVGDVEVWWGMWG